MKEVKKNSPPSPFPNNASEIRTPPQDLECEQSVLGAMMLSETALIEVQEILDENDFYREANRKIFRAMVYLQSKAEPVDITTLAAELKRVGDFEAVGGLTALIQLVERVPTSANAEYYAKIVKEHSRKRWFINRATHAVSDTYTGEMDSNEIVEALVGDIITVSNVRGSLEPVQAASEAYEIMTTPEKFGRIPTGFDFFDGKLGGIPRRVLTTITGAQESGKSTFAQNMCVHMSKAGRRVAYILLDDTVDTLVKRQCCILGNVPNWKMDSTDAKILHPSVRTGLLNDWTKLGIRVCGMAQVGTDFRSLNLWILREWRQRKIDCFFIDSASMVKYPQVKFEHQEQALSNMVDAFTEMSQKMNVGMVCLVEQPASATKSKFNEGHDNEKGTTRWRYRARFRIHVSRHAKHEEDKSRENIAIVKITKNSDGPKPPAFWFEGDRATYKWAEVETV